MIAPTPARRQPSADLTRWADLGLNVRDARDVATNGLLFPLVAEVLAKQPGLASRMVDAFNVPSALEAGIPFDTSGGARRIVLPFDAPIVRAGLDSATATKGSELKIAQAGAFVPPVLGQSVCVRAGSTVETREYYAADAGISAQATSEDLAENSSAATAPDTITTVPFTPNLKATFTQLQVSVQELVAAAKNWQLQDRLFSHMADTTRQQIDRNALIGATGGANAVGLTANTAIALYAFGTNGALPTWPLLRGMTRDVLKTKAPDIGPNRAWVGSPTLKYKMEIIERASGNGMLVENDLLGGAPMFASTTMPDTLTKGTASGICSSLVYGADWSQLAILLFGGMELVIDPYRLKKQGLVELSIILLYDVVCRQPAVFSRALDVLTA